MTPNDDAFPAGRKLPADPPAWLVVLDLGDDYLLEYRRLPRNQEQYEQARFAYAEACFEAQRVYEGGWSSGDPDFYDGPINQWNPDESVLLHFALFLLSLHGQGAADTIDKALEWLHTDPEWPVLDGSDPTNPAEEASLAYREQQCSELIDAIEAHRTQLMSLLSQGHEAAWCPRPEYAIGNDS